MQPTAGDYCNRYRALVAEVMTMLQLEDSWVYQAGIWKGEERAEEKGKEEGKRKGFRTAIQIVLNACSPSKWALTDPRVAELTARLTCLPATEERPWADYGDLAAAVVLTPEKHGLRDPAARREAEVEVNALDPSLYGLGRKEFCFLMDTLFMTPKHKTTHAALRDEIAARLDIEVR